MRILVVEDEELIRLILAEALADEGFQVVETSSGDEAVRLIDAPDGFHAVITDIQMPGTQDGIAVGRHARGRYPLIPVIYVTGRPDVLSRAGPLSASDAIVVKPYAPSEVLAALRRLLPGTNQLMP